MRLESRSRRLASGLAALIIASGLLGCHSVPVARIAPAPNRPQSSLASAGRAALFPATVALDVPSEMSSIDPAASRAVGSTEPSGGLSEPAMAEAAPPATATAASETLPIPSVPTTPLLDAAVERARSATDRPDADLTHAFVPTSEVSLPPAAPDPATSMTVVPAPVATPALAPAPAEPAKPEDAWRDEVRKLAGLARLGGEQAGPGTGSPWDLRSKVVAWLADPGIRPELGQHDGDGVRSVLRALEEASEPAPARGDDLRAAVRVLEDRAPLELLDIRICSRVDDFGVFETFDPPVRKAGDQMVIYCEVDGLRTDATSSGYRTRLAVQVEVIPGGGGVPVLAQPLGTFEETCRRRRRDYYIAHKLALPKTLPPGEYRLRLTGRDLVTDGAATREIAFAIAR